MKWGVRRKVVVFLYDLPRSVLLGPIAKSYFQKSPEAKKCIPTMHFIWRRFTFFDLQQNVDNGKIAECLQDTSVAVATSGNSYVIVCDVLGWAHLISRSWEVTSFKAYEVSVLLAQQYQHDPYLVTIGEDETGGQPLLKVWDWSVTDRRGGPACARLARAVPSHLRPTTPTALAICDNKNLVAVGFQDGSVTLFRGDITRQRSGKMKTLTDTGSAPITGLAFKGTEKLFIVSRGAVMVHSVGTERVTTLERMGAPPGCSVLADKQNLMLATPPAIYCYTTEGRGPCYALEGEKVRLDWFRSYLVITTNETPLKNDNASTSNAPIPKSHHITILDIQNKFIVFSKTFEEIDAVITEWGSFYILTKNKELIYLDEKDLQSKLTLLFKKNLYDVAIRIASSQHYDAVGLTEIYKHYGDHLYSKGDLKGAIDQYVKTIGWLETSYVIRKYLESRHLEPLITYLEELHKKGYATEDHTTLLLTCYVKIDQHDQQGKLKEFINSKDKCIEFDVDVAIKVVRQVSPEDAITLAKNYKCHDWCLKILLEDQRDYTTALDYIAELEFEDADLYMKKYGHVLIQNAPDESTEFLKLLCTDYKPRSALLVDESTLSGGTREKQAASPDDFIHLFLNNSERLTDLLEHMIKSDLPCSKLIYNALIEHYIHVCVTTNESVINLARKEISTDNDQNYDHHGIEHLPSKQRDLIQARLETNIEKSQYEEKIMKVLKEPDANYDKDQTLIICQMLGFKPGVLHLYEENKLWRGQVSLHMRCDEAERAVAVCQRRARTGAPARLWLDVLWSAAPPRCLPGLLTVIDNEKLLSPILVIDCLTSTPSYTLGDVRKYLMNVLKTENDVITREQELANKYRSECEKMKAQIQTLQNEPITFQSSRCAACNRPLELPSVHFLCQHSYHQHCFQSYSEHDSECPSCASQNQKRNESTTHAAETLHSRLHKEPDPYAVVSEYFGRGLFNKITVVTDGDSEPGVTSPAPTPAPPPALAQTYGPGAEAKLRLQEGQSKQLYINNGSKTNIPKSTGVIPVPEGRMRMLEQQQYSSSLEANISRLPEPVHMRTSPINARKKATSSNSISAEVSPNISSVISNLTSKNPFEDEDDIYDEAKNPFADEKVNDPTNPFCDDEDYDKNLNPFS